MDAPNLLLALAAIYPRYTPDGGLYTLAHHRRCVGWGGSWWRTPCDEPQNKLVSILLPISSSPLRCEVHAFAGAKAFVKLFRKAEVGHFDVSTHSPVAEEYVSCVGRARRLNHSCDNNILKHICSATDITCKKAMSTANLWQTAIQAIKVYTMALNGRKRE